MFKKFIAHMKKLLKDRTFQGSVLHFSAFFAVLSVFVTLTATHVITSNPQTVLPAEYATIPVNQMDESSLEQALRSHDPKVQGVIFFNGLNSVVVLGKGLDHDLLVRNVDVDEMRILAEADHLPVESKAAAVDTNFTDLISGWWVVAVLAQLFWLMRILFFKRKGGTVYCRARVFFSSLPAAAENLVKASGLTPLRFNVYLLIGLVAINGLGFGLKLYQDRDVYVLPSEISDAFHVQPWQISRYLESSPQQFDRVTLVPQLNTAYAVLRLESTIPDVSADAAPAATAAPAPAARRGRFPLPAPTPQPYVVPAALAPTLYSRRITFAPGPEGKAQFDAFAAQVRADKVECKVVPAVHKTDPFETMTFAGSIVSVGLGLLALFTLINVFYLKKKADQVEQISKGEIHDPRLVGAGGAAGHGGTIVVTRKEDKKTFADVAGCQEAIDELVVVKKKIMRPRLYKIFGAPVPNGVILYGPPGTGKTLLARALAGEVGGSFQALSGSEFVEMYVGVGAKRVREAYAKARSHARKTGRISIVFIDEFDALAKKRSTSNQGGDKEYEQTLNQLLVEMNGFGNHGLVLTMAATNRLDILDEAVLRPGRFDIKVKVPKPDRKGRGLIFGIYLKKLKLVLIGEGEDRERNYQALLDDLARRSHDFSGAEIEGAIKDGATIAVERQFGDVLEDITDEQEKEYRERAIITPEDLHLGIDKMAYGTQIKSRVRTDKERKATAIHEIGHAAVPTEMKGDPVNRITIVMTDKSLGLMDSSPEEGERYDWTDEQFTIRLHMMLAGRAAEKVLLGKISTGASNDFERASQLARQMVGVYGMSSAFGNKSIPLDEHGFPVSNIGETMLKTFNDAWGKIIDEAQARTEAFIEKHRAQIEHCAEALYDQETLTGDEFRRLWAEAASRAEQAN